ncbi:phosphoribosylaminoimidazolecarboxamide formyltransferase / IMP cyclohydrolase [Desulfarculales bacterium]
MDRKVMRALLSVTNKGGLVDFAKGLSDMGVALISTGGTAKALRQGGLQVVDVAEVTGHPEILDGQVKTLHPRIHGGILARRDDPNHHAQLTEHHIATIDLVCVNLYVFEATVAMLGCTLADAVENLTSVVLPDPGLAKNHQDVTVVTDPVDYPIILQEMRDNGGQISLASGSAWRPRPPSDQPLRRSYRRLPGEPGSDHVEDRLCHCVF